MTVALANYHKSFDTVHEVMTELDGSNWFVVIDEPPHSGLGIYLSYPELRHFTNTHSTNAMIIANMLDNEVDNTITGLHHCTSYSFWS